MPLKISIRSCRHIYGKNTHYIALNFNVNQSDAAEMKSTLMPFIKK